MANSIKKYRELTKITQAELARKLSVQTQSVWRWENGTRISHWSDISAMCKLFKCTADALMNENPTQPPAGSEALQGEMETD